MKVSGLITATCLAFFAAIFIYLAFFGKELTPQSHLICLLAGIGIGALASIIALLVDILDNIQRKLN